jgi:hypothetical protein
MELPTFSVDKCDGTGKFSLCRHCKKKMSGVCITWYGEEEKKRVKKAEESKEKSRDKWEQKRAAQSPFGGFGGGFGSHVGYFSDEPFGDYDGGGFGACDIGGIVDYYKYGYDPCWTGDAGKDFGPEPDGLDDDEDDFQDNGRGLRGMGQTLTVT